MAYSVVAELKQYNVVTHVCIAITILQHTLAIVL
jgi:hypothetical protein